MQRSSIHAHQGARYFYVLCVVPFVIGCQVVGAFDSFAGAHDSGEPDSPLVDAAREAGQPVTMSGWVLNLDDNPIAGATVRFREISETATTNGSGAFSLRVPTETSLTAVLDAPGEVTTVEQTLVVHSDVAALTFVMATPQQYSVISSFATTSATTGNFFVNVISKGACTAVGAHLSDDPPSGTIFYAASNHLPDATGTAIEPMAPGAYVVGAAGTLTVSLTGAPAPCSQNPWPADVGAYSRLGPVIVQPGALHDMTVFVQ